jgi:hypothetical protein
MTEPTGPQPEPAERDAADVRESWVFRRRDRIVEEIQRNRRGEYRVPTWVLAVALAVFVVGWLLLIALS